MDPRVDEPEGLRTTAKDEPEGLRPTAKDVNGTGRTVRIHPRPKHLPCLPPKNESRHGSSIETN